MNFYLLLITSMVPCGLSFIVKPFTFKPTVYPADPFDADADAKFLNTAMGVDTDKSAILNLLTHRSLAQRLIIVEKFKLSPYLANLKSALGTLFFHELKPLRFAVAPLVTPLPEFYANILHEATFHWGTDEDAIIETLVPLNNSQLKNVSAAYKDLYGTNLVDDLEDDTSGDFQTLLVSLMEANRDEIPEAVQEAERERVSWDVEALLSDDEEKYGPKNLLFNTFFTTRSYDHLRRIFIVYESRAGYTIEDGIKQVFSGHAKDAYLAIVQCARYPPIYFARKLHWAMAGSGTAEAGLTRIIIARSEIDLGDIKEAYEGMYKRSLAADVEDDTSGEYKNLLLNLIGR